MPVKDTCGVGWGCVDYNQYYKHVFVCNCGWAGVVVLNGKEIPVDSGRYKHRKKRPNCKLEIFHKSVTKTIHSNPNNFKDDID